MDTSNLSSGTVISDQSTTLEVPNPKNLIELNHSQKIQWFRDIFNHPTYFSNCNELFNEYESRKCTKFEDQMNRILPSLMSGWRSSAIKHGYMETFSINVWQSLSDKEKSNHSLINCEACYLSTFQHRRLFIVSPYLKVKMEEM